MTRNIALGRPDLGEEELAAIAEVFRSGWPAGAGPACRAFESEFAAAMGVPHALATNNCGAALHLGLLCLGVGPADEVIVADYTFPATGHSVVWTGATPVFADVRGDTGTVDPDSVAALIGPRTVGIIAVDVAGLPADYEPLQTLATRHGLWLMEDAACAAGATYRGQPAGSVADIAAFSFHGRKGITSGEGGALVSARGDLIEKARTMHTYGIGPALSREGSRELVIPAFDEIGHNYRLSDVAAAIMRVQLRRMPGFLAARDSVAQRYAAGLSDVAGLALPVVPPDRTHPWQAYLVTVDEDIDRDAVVLQLRNRGVGSTFGTYASHLQPVYGRTNPCPVSASLFARQLALPMHTLLDEADVDYVIQQVRTVLADPAVRRS
ncbi:MAG: pyridoxal phosphate-dependent aminotransferase [Actinomycetales bacterium]|nr:MAG: pyridoxal phosphate-dependent aminotransferase [Actinomycetales bacterium]